MCEQYPSKYIKNESYNKNSENSSNFGIDANVKANIKSIQSQAFFKRKIGNFKVKQLQIAYSIFVL